MVDFVFPRRCVGCRREGNYFCAACLEKGERRRFLVCPYCGRRSALGVTHAGCERQFGLDGLVSVLAYRGEVRRAVKKLKYRLVADLAGELAVLMVGLMGKGDFFPKFDTSWVLMPVPLHPKRERWRGFNQARVLGRRVAEKEGWVFENGILKREKETKPQAELKSRKERWLNVYGAFGVDPEAEFRILGSKLIVFDDVWTTGLTIKECARVLKRKGAAKVWGLTLAR